MAAVSRVTDQIATRSSALGIAVETAHSRPLIITHIITDLDTGGAEMMLYETLAQMNRDAFQAEVISLRPTGALGEKIARQGIPVRSLNMSRGVPDLRALFRLVNYLRQQSPDLIQTWMYHANLMGGIAAQLAGRIPVVWGIHHSNFDPKKSKRRTVWTMKAGALLSGLIPREIICCGESPKRVHIEMGYDARKMKVITNGFDVAKFRPDPEARIAIRQELGIPLEAPIIGLIARFHPKKDHRTFIEAAGLLHQTNPQTCFILCGDEVTAQNQVLVDWINEAGISAQCRLLGIREDMPRVTAALDIATSSSSYGEGFPIVLGEAMACGVPCVVTDVGDSALLVGLTGQVVAASSAGSLAKAWQQVLALSLEERQQLGQAARHRIEKNFGAPLMVKKYENLYKELFLCVTE